MIKSIHQFEEKGITKLENLHEDFYKNPQDICTFVLGITKEVHQLGLNIIAEALEEMDDAIRNSITRKKSWNIVRTDRTQLLTSLGNVYYHKTLFINKNSGERRYLLDYQMEQEGYERMTPDAEARLLEEAVKSSYSHGGKSVSLTDSVSRQTVKNKIHELYIPVQPKGSNTEKRKVEYLYIDADEDHVALQFENKRDDLKNNARLGKRNNIITKLIYVYEGVENVNIRSRRRKLINPRYFSGVYSGTSGNQELWSEVAEYIQMTYDIDSVKMIFVNGDGGSWIKTAKDYINPMTFILDKFHINKSIMEAVPGYEVEAVEMRQDIYKALKNVQKKKLNSIFDEMEKDVNQSRSARIEKCRKYLSDNWSAIKNGQKYGKLLHGCSAEGHVSHILSSRLSSRPMGWSIRGVDQMSRLRAYVANHEDLLELVKMQREMRKEHEVVEKPQYTSAAMLHFETNSRKPYGKYFDKMYTHISRQVKKIAYFQCGIKGL